jgi:hypothetical protein
MTRNGTAAETQPQASEVSSGSDQGAADTPAQQPLEVDLEAILEDETHPDFALLYKFISMC